MKKMRTKQNRQNKLNKQNKKNNRTRHKKQHGGSVVNTIDEINNAVQTGQPIATSTNESQKPGAGVVDIITNAGDPNTPIGKSINNVFNPDGTTRDETDGNNQKSEQLQSYLQYIEQHPNFVQSTLSNILVKPTAYIINDLGSLLNVDMNNPEKLKTQLDEMADSIQDPVERNKILNYNAQVLAVYLTASKPSIDIISGIFSQEVGLILSDLVYNMSMSIQNMIPGFTLFNDIRQMLLSIVQATTTLAQLTNTGVISTQENLQQLNKSIMNEVDSKNKLVIEQKKQAEILEKQNKLVEFILEKPEIIDSYIKYLNKTKNENLTINDIIPTTDETNMTGGRKKNRVNLDKECENILNAIKDSLNDYNK
jgi:hypothetical protein